MPNTDDARSLLERILTSGEHSDMTICCGAYKHQVHRLIISTQSDVLVRMCNEKFHEGKTGVNNLPDDDPEAINIMVQHLYKQDYKDTEPGLLLDDEDRALLNLRVYAVAHKYIILSLLECATDEFEEWSFAAKITEPWRGVVEVVWEGNEFSALCPIIEKQIADGIDSMLNENWMPFIDKGMELGRLSSAGFVRRLVEGKNRIINSLRDREERRKTDIKKLKGKIEGYRNSIGSIVLD
ncbi:BTB/POZ domain protein [Penicillium sp. DV-2018c]|nr:BTB/POZ domain protein [Penicillium sp. DV-2018c]KAJ5559347.1 BTB/POZ domain protein [Penicillium sp. DV-2018c]